MGIIDIPLGKEAILLVKSMISTGKIILPIGRRAIPFRLIDIPTGKEVIPSVKSMIFMGKKVLPLGRIMISME